MKKILGIIGFLTAMATASAGMQFYNTAGANLGVFAVAKCSTGMTCTNVGGKLNIVSSPSLLGPLTLENGMVLDNSSASLVAFTSASDDTNLKLVGFEAKDAVLSLWADQGDDTADKYSLVSDHTNNKLTFYNGSTALFAFSSAGVITLADSETLTDASDVVTLGFDDAAADFRLKAFEATDSSLVLQADESDDNGDDWKLSSVASDDSFTISNDASGSQVAKLTIAASTGNVSLVGSLAGDGGDSLSGFLQKQVTATATTITAAQCGSTFINAGAIQMELPEASTVVGCRLTFIVNNATAFTINPDNADQIVLLTNAAGDAIQADAVGESITIQAVDATNWAPVGAEKGTWSDVD